MAEKLILFRSREVKLESKSQLDRFSSTFPMYSAKLKKVFSGRLRVSELKKQLSILETQKGNLNKRSVIRIGVLGGISQERRNYQQLLGAVKDLENSGHKVELLFLGRYVGPESEGVLDVFSPWVSAGPSRDNPEMSELFLIQILKL